MSKQTKKPWEIEKTSFEEYWRPDNHYNVGPAYGITKIEDARLIAAAPDLLEALINLEAMTERYRQSGAPIPDAQKSARAAIAKATGEEA